MQTYQNQPSKNPISAEPWQTYSHTHTHSMNKSHTVVGLSCSSLFSLLSQAAASPSTPPTPQTPWIQQQQFSSYPVWFQMVSVWIGWNLYPKGNTLYVEGVNKTNKNNLCISLNGTAWKVTIKVHIQTWFNWSCIKVNSYHSGGEEQPQEKWKKVTESMRWGKHRECLSSIISKNMRGLSPNIRKKPQTGVTRVDHTLKYTTAQTPSCWHARKHTIKLNHPPTHTHTLTLTHTCIDYHMLVTDPNEV